MSKPKRKEQKGATWEMLTEQQQIDVDSMFRTIVRVVRGYKARKAAEA